MAIKAEHLAVALSAANPFGNGRHITDEERKELKIQIATLKSQGYDFTDIAPALNISYNLIFDWKGQDQEFAKMLENAKLIRHDQNETSAFNIAIDGVTDIVVNAGRVVMDPADQTKPLLRTTHDLAHKQFMLKAMDRATYGDKVQNDTNVNLRADQANAELDAAIATARAAVAARHQARDPGDIEGERS